MTQASISKSAIRSNSIDEAVDLIRDSYRVLLTNFTGGSYIENDTEYGFRCEIVNKRNFASGKVVDGHEEGFYLYVTPIKITKNPQNGREQVNSFMDNRSEVFLSEDRDEAHDKINETLLVKIFDSLTN